MPNSTRLQPHNGSFSGTASIVLEPALNAISNINNVNSLNSGNSPPIGFQPAPSNSVGGVGGIGGHYPNIPLNTEAAKAFGRPPQPVVSPANRLYESGKLRRPRPKPASLESKSAEIIKEDDDTDAWYVYYIM